MTLPNNSRWPVIIYDDREAVQPPLSSIVGHRGFGSVRVRNQTLYSRLCDALPDWAQGQLVRVTGTTQLHSPENALPHLADASGVIVIAARGAVLDPDGFAQQIERLALADRAIADRRRHPLIMGFVSVADFLDEWDAFAAAPLHTAPGEWSDVALFAAPHSLVDISDRAQFLDFIAGATSPREFNQIQIDPLVYVKRSTDKAKLKAEHDYYSLIPAQMRPWMVGAYNYLDTGETAQYEMPRRFYADAAIQWIHNAWDITTFSRFLDRIFSFFDGRPVKAVSRDAVEAVTRRLYIDKVSERFDLLHNSDRGAQILALLRASNGGDALLSAYDVYFDRVERRWSSLRGADHLAIGHGDPCLSNILYDDSSLTMQLIDPKGATAQDELWTHALYDYAKLSHSILGDYDFINNRMFSVQLSADARLELKFVEQTREAFKAEFRKRISERMDFDVLRLAEASLFLSMLPLHLDHMDKVAAFLMRANEILAEQKP